MSGDDLLRELARDPERAALLLDVDGVLAPIVSRPEDAVVPEETRTELRRLAARYGLVACVSGRPAADAARVLGVDGIRIVGEHGLGLDPAAAEWSERLHAFADVVDWPVERKPLSVSLHYRDAADEDAARAHLDEVAERARAEGLVARFGRKVLELRPPVAANKGTAVGHLLGERELRRALYAGDDTTDLDAFDALGGLELGVRVAVATPEGPPELRERADVVVASPAEFLGLLRRL
ncbi:MAG: trehalose-phosphatase [Thermoleophilia bacterium]|nr:trehalose-phosphatase [Thermoleophilia bacterium]